MTKYRYDESRKRRRITNLEKPFLMTAGYILEFKYEVISKEEGSLPISQTIDVSIQVNKALEVRNSDLLFTYS